jgi:PST family polysaccharide transporter
VLLSLSLQAATAVVPLALLPFYARTLGADGLGLLAVGQAVGLLIAGVVDFGFHISAARLVAARIDDRRYLGRIVSDVLFAKLLVALPAGTATVVVCAFVPIFENNAPLLVSSVVFGVFQGLSFFWFFGGIQRQSYGAAMELAAKLTAMCAVFMLVRTSADAWKVQASFAASQAFWVGIAGLLVYRRAPFDAWSLNGMRRMLLDGRHVFAQHAIGMFYNNCTAMLLGFVSPAQAVGIYAAAEKIARIPLMPIMPLRQVLFPIMAKHTAHNGATSRRYWRMLLAIYGLAMTACGLLLFWQADLIVQIVLGNDFQHALTPLRILSVLPVIAGVGEIFGVFWLLSHKRDSPLTQTVSIVTGMHIVLVIGLGWSLGASGGSLAVILSQGLALGLVIFLALQMRPGPFAE